MTVSGACLRRSGRALGLGIVIALVNLATVGAEEQAPARETLPRALQKRVPESVEDLRAIQNHIKAVLKKVMPCVVGLRIGPSQGSGVIISRDGYVLTAGHVSGEPGRKVRVILHDGREVEGETLGANRGIDSGLVKITTAGEWPFVGMGSATKLDKGNWCIGIGHPRGYMKGRAPVVRVGRVLDADDHLIRTDCVLVGGDSGGPLFDMTGKVIGIHSRIGTPLTANIHVPVDTYRATWDRLAGSEVWGGSPFTRTSRAYLGIVADPESRACRIQEVTPDSPAAKAGIQPDDVVTMFAGKRINSFDDLHALVSDQKPGTEVILQVQRGDETLDLRVVLGRRPVDEP